MKASLFWLLLGLICAFVIAATVGGAFGGSIAASKSHHTETTTQSMSTRYPIPIHLKHSVTFVKQKLSRLYQHRNHPLFVSKPFPFSLTINPNHNTHPNQRLLQPKQLDL
ncbi:hypothetical protein NA56DRAFT_646875 [Hyaloscypha hepaticicola]|uniref:Uncharacterized protein n=1 Tax=Hyaloscypha hepaticicola TaxID=2082293 RepID=A0A2J6Q157_9HELO|nr:hypothetical protein NA56DRAFT_646875 [Hyaloscypha hepaticicola]